ncbi:hypothetical protein FHS27_001628 [Rhodopirellula rubra]|uniref:Uncharacterized protein n=1 Tax=Aporhodopirellula rubra TaxID=980271 RepID=A0A7W5H4X7_9BACT|nr:hypothetical protein [Aporhodopirellula rubra]MBB3205824.1 hypothetical protein [Aporhodopirellula rubra]
MVLALVSRWTIMDFYFEPGGTPKQSGNPFHTRVLKRLNIRRFCGGRRNAFAAPDGSISDLYRLGKWSTANSDHVMCPLLQQESILQHWTRFIVARSRTRYR